MRKMKFKYLFLAAAMFAVAACEDPQENGLEPEQDPSGDVNYWYIHGLAPKGVKSIATQGYTENYDNAGRITSFVSDNSSTTYTYNSKGLPATIVSTDIYDGKEYSTTQAFEYNNFGAFCPYPMGPGHVFHLWENGLVPDLSKVTWTSEEDGTIVMEYKFEGNELIISTSGGNRTMPDSLGNMVPVVYDDLVFEYRGAYPYQISLEHEFLGPMTYQENGMFDSYVEGFYSWTPGFEGFVTTHRTRTASKDFKNMMLMTREVSKYFNDGEADPYDIETIVCSYDEKGNLLREEVTHTQEGCDHIITNYNYTFDSKGNWIKVDASNQNLNYPDWSNDWSEERQISYY